MKVIVFFSNHYFQLQNINKQGKNIRCFALFLIFVRMQQQKLVQKSFLRNQLYCYSLIYLEPRISHLVKVLTYLKNFWMEKFSGALDCKWRRQSSSGSWPTWRLHFTATTCNSDRVHFQSGTDQDQRTRSKRKIVWILEYFKKTPESAGKNYR